MPAAGGDGPPKAVNLRDLSDVSPALRKGVLFRCSQIYEPELLQELRVRTVVDLRGRAEIQRKHRHHHHHHQHADAAPSTRGAAAAPAAAGVQPTPPPARAPGAAARQGGDSGSGGSGSGSSSSSGYDTESDAAAAASGAAGASAAATEPRPEPTTPETLTADVLGHLVRGEAPMEALAAVAGGGSSREAEVVAVSEGEGAAAALRGGGDPAAVRLTFDVIPAREFGKAMLRMPLRVWRSAVGNLVSGADPRKPFVNAFADEQLLGFTKYYVLILEHSTKNLAAVMRVFTARDALPALVHCAHGKDRTAVVIMLLLLACGVSPEAIVSDYIQSEQELRRYRASLGLDSATAAGAAIARTLIPLDDAIIASTSDTMRAVLRYLSDTYGSPDAYLERRLGLSAREVAAIRRSLMTPEALAAFEAAQPPAAAGGAGQA